MSMSQVYQQSPTYPQYSDEKKEDPPLGSITVDRGDTKPPLSPRSPPTPYLKMNEQHLSTPATAASTPASARSIGLSASKRRAKAAGSAGLSELSKQLRIMQAQNEAQSVEINRLERQLRILAELQGISVADLRKALEDACANEAFDELQNRVSKLRHELEAATLMRQKELRQDASAPHIANLELRVGELEEVEEKHQNEIHHLYEQLRHEKEKAARLEAEGAQAKSDAQDYLDKLNKERSKASGLEQAFQNKLAQHQAEQAKRMQGMAKAAKEAAAAGARDAEGLSSVGRAQVESAKAEADRLAKLLAEQEAKFLEAESQRAAERDALARKARDAEEEARRLQAELKADRDKTDLTVQQLQNADSQSDLRLAQFKARFAVQDERLEDMGQQLSSLYTAFGILKEDADADAKRRSALESNLNEADREMARHFDGNEDQQNRPSQRTLGSTAAKQSRKSNSGSTAASLAKSRKSYSGSTAASRAKDGEDPTIQAQRRALQRYSFSEFPEDGSKKEAALLRSAPSQPILDPWNSAEQRKIAEHEASASASVPRTITTPSSGSHGSDSKREGTSTLPAVVAQPFPPTPSSPAKRTPGTWQLLFPEPEKVSTQTYTTPATGNGDDGLLIRGMLVVKSKSIMRKWKPKYCKLYAQGNHFQWDMEGKSYTLGYGISKVDFNPNHPMSFIVHTNPFDEMAPVVHAAASTEADYHSWMAALTKITTGAPYEIPLEAAPSSAYAALPVSSADSIVSGLSAEEQEAADLERALRLSQLS